MFEIQSGRPAGEVYHRWVFKTHSPAMAANCARAMAKGIANLPAHERESWLFGPHIYKRDTAAAITHWNGFEEVAAPVWSGRL